MNVGGMEHEKETGPAMGKRVTVKIPEKMRNNRTSLTIKEIPAVSSLPARRPSRPAQNRPADPAGISLKGLLTAHKFSKGLRERAAGKLAARRGTGCITTKPAIIINEKVPAGSAQPCERFPGARASQLMQSFLACRLDGVGYIASSAGSLAQDLCTELRERMRVISPGRYKLVCAVTVGQPGQQGALQASRCLWDAHSDGSISNVYQNPQLFCSATVYAVYFE